MSLGERMSDLGGTVRDARDAERLWRPTGQEIFNAKSPAEQDAMLGPKAAEAVRTGEVSLDQLVEVSRLDSDAPDYITQKPLPQEGE